MHAFFHIFSWVPLRAAAVIPLKKIPLHSAYPIITELRSEISVEVPVGILKVFILEFPNKFFFQKLFQEFLEILLETTLGVPWDFLVVSSDFFYDFLKNSLSVCLRFSSEGSNNCPIHIYLGGLFTRIASQRKVFHKKTPEKNLQISTKFIYQFSWEFLSFFQVSRCSAWIPLRFIQEFLQELH